MNYLIEFGIKLIPILSILFVILLISNKIYIKIRSRYNILVNCWFCNDNTKVPFIDRNSWTCPICQQYNGFDSDGNYNKEIREQFDITKNKIFNMTNTNAIGLNTSYRSSSFNDYVFPSNGFCFDCNENQRIKIEKIGQFEPKKESKFNDELKIYKSQLEQQYRLCSTCERHLKKVLREKKKMVLGSKLLDFIVRGTQKIQRNSKLKNFKSKPYKYMKVFISLIILFLGIINFCLVIHGVFDKQQGYNVLNDPFVQGILMFTSYFSKSLSFIKSYIDLVFDYYFVHKTFLYLRTLLIMTSHFFDIKTPNFTNLNNLIFISMPFCGIFLSFIRNAMDRFHLTRATILLTIWSFQAAIISMEQTAKIFELITATCIMILSIPHWNYEQIMNESDSSFHKIYSAENYYLNENEDEEDSISLQSSNLNLSNSSYRSTGYRSLINPSFNTQRTSSSLNLNKFDIKSSLGQINSKGNLFTSNLELHRPASLNNIPHNSSFCCGIINNSVNKTLTGGYKFDNQNFLPTDFIDSNNAKNNFSINKIPAPMCSPCSQYSVCSSYNGRQPVLTPSRFGNEIDINSHHSLNTSWLSGGYFNQKKDSPYQQQKREHDSRSSSLSSGFESNSSNFLPTQLHNNKDVCRENSYCTENVNNFHNNIFSHLNQATLSNFGPDQFHHSQWNSFRPISQSMQNLNNYDLRATNLINSDIDWRRSNFKEFSPLPMNMFNLNKINEELPPVMKRNSLLRNYHQQNSLLEN